MPTNPDEFSKRDEGIPNVLRPLSASERDRRTVEGGVLFTASRAVVLVLFIVSVMILARLLKPEDFGLLAFSGILFGVLLKFKNLGLSAAIVQASEIDDQTLSGIFWFNCKFNALLLGVASLAAPVMMLIFDELALLWVIPVIAVATCMHYVCGIHEGLLRRQMRFRLLVAINLASLFASVAVALAAAWAGMGYWALVLQEVVRELLSALLLVLTTGWMPRRVKSDHEQRQRIRSLIKYGGNLSASNVISYLARNADFVLVGYLSGTAALGLYEKAFKWAYFPFNQLYLPTIQVAMSKFARLQDNHGAYRKSFQRTVMVTYGSIIPILALLFVKAEEVILILLGEQWIEAIPLFRILLVGMIFHNMPHLLKWVYKSEGRTGTLLRWTIGSSPVVVAGSAIGAVWGPKGIALGFSVAYGVLYLPAILVCFRGSPLRIGDLLIPMWPPIVCAVLSAWLAWWLAAFLETGYLLGDLAVTVLLMGPLYLLFYVLMPFGRQRVNELKIAFAPVFQRGKSDGG